MKLLIHDLTASGLTQVLAPDRNLFLAALRPHIYRHGNPTGTLSIEVRDSDDNLLATSESIDISDIGSDTYFHGYVRFLVEVGLRKNQQYKFKLVGAGGYTFSESNFIGWCNDYDLQKYPQGYVSTNDFYNPLDIEIWERKTK